ncbi:SCO family protein [Azospirillum sp. TSO22-1]|uniref:SCO family protein n=1 Tax=Azospirillum sp. TSO22-1 TaxID=716789 RepID=UPI000D60FC40|nr:SCO family protein [Azospirillum sp. TSO22-1]PWC43478.1 electron transporter SenC [Azospirillum sp. TSO22-1]
MKARILRIALASLVGLAIAAGIAWWQVRHATQQVATSAAAVGGPFRLTDHTGKAVTDADYRGKYLLIYFGYTFCPDVCPTELSTMAAALDKLGPTADTVQPLFITIDPERDTVAHMADYVPLFHPRLVGLTGTPDEVRTVAREYRVYAAKAPGSSGEAYLMDHSSFVYLMGPDGKFVAVFPGGTGPEKMAADIKKRTGG